VFQVVISFNISQLRLEDNEENEDNEDNENKNKNYFVSNFQIMKPETISVTTVWMTSLRA
jgi:hypothetical protein